jgi:HAD superfamily hydrolase (TIGR01509 family)
MQAVRLSFPSDRLQWETSDGSEAEAIGQPSHRYRRGLQRHRLAAATMEKAMQALKGVLLDVDGTLIDSNEAHASAWCQALHEAGIPVDFRTVRKLIGKGGDKLLPEVDGIDNDSTRGQAIGKRRAEIFHDKYLPNLRPFAGVRALLARLSGAGLRLAVASSAKTEELHGLLRICGAEELAEKSTSSDDANNSKPDPDIVHAALKRIGLHSAQVLLLGDTPYDVEAGLRAKVNVIALRCGGWNSADLAGALEVYDDPADLLAQFETSAFTRLR